MTRKGLFSSIGYAVVVATFAAATLTVMVPAVAEAGSAGKGLSAVPATRNDTDFSSARRSYHRRGRGTAAGAFAAMAGTGLAIAASRNRDAYDGDWRCSPLYCGPNYYGSDRYYGGYGYGGSSTPSVAW